MTGFRGCRTKQYTTAKTRCAPWFLHSASEGLLETRQHQDMAVVFAVVSGRPKLSGALRVLHSPPNGGRSAHGTEGFKQILRVRTHLPGFFGAARLDEFLRFTVFRELTEILNRFFSKAGRIPCIRSSAKKATRRKAAWKASRLNSSTFPFSFGSTEWEFGNCSARWRAGRPKKLAPALAEPDYPRLPPARHLPLPRRLGAILPQLHPAL